MHADPLVPNDEDGDSDLAFIRSYRQILTDASWLIDRYVQDAYGMP